MGLKLGLGWTAALVVACGATEQPRSTPTPKRIAAPTSTVTASTADVATSAQPVAPPSPPPPCPEDMVFVDTSYCDNASSRCVKDEYEKANHLTICHRFAPGQRCNGELRRQRYCIDRYEYPNEKGGHPPVNVSAFDGAMMCAEQGKRLCFESEWVAACEGPNKLPFPYGLERSGEMCNIDNRYIAPSLKRAYSGHLPTRDAELRRLDQSKPSGAMETCKSGFGVYDLTGNFDEWVLSERKRGKSGWAALKGGAWGHVRNACRPTTTSHPPQFTYYFISFRCCRDADVDGLPPAPDDLTVWNPPAPPPRPAPGGGQRGWSP